jgi:uncharacterized protein
VFDDIDWGTSNMMTQTRHRLRENGRTWQELAAFRDADRPQDYDRLVHEQPGLLKEKQ